MKEWARGTKATYHSIVLRIVGWGITDAMITPENIPLGNVMKSKLQKCVKMGGQSGQERREKESRRGLPFPTGWNKIGKERRDSKHALKLRLT